ncbi:recombinase family protein [Streptomyces sp. NPDC056738]|uniref:recombinase family protein n=1 Tax=Streptomyces sp. NPDC056738 TaxID=3345933 RepID=UPI003680CD35
MPQLAEPAAAVEQFDCPPCEVPAGSTCRTRGGKVAPKYHTPRFMLVPQLRAELEVKTPAARGPGRAWERGPVIDVAVPEAATAPTRVGYARCSTAQQELQSQLDALAEAGCDPVFSEKISTRIKVRPDFVRAMDFARTIKKAVPHQRVIFTVHEMKRLGRGAAELLAIAEDLRHHDIQLELLTGPLQGIYDPSGHGAALFAFFAGVAESEREYIREKSLEGQASARERGRHGGRPKVVDDDMADYARNLRANGVSVPLIAQKLVITSGKNKGQRPSVATVYRILSEGEAE